MTGDPFVHLHVASGYSMRHGANHPADLVARAAEHGMGALALTDRDGLYGAVKFAIACRAAGIRPLFGVDLAVDPVAGAGDHGAHAFELLVGMVDVGLPALQLRMAHGSKPNDGT